MPTLTDLQQLLIIVGLIGLVGIIAFSQNIIASLEMYRLRRIWNEAMNK